MADTKTAQPYPDTSRNLDRQNTYNTSVNYRAADCINVLFPIPEPATPTRFFALMVKAIWSDTLEYSLIFDGGWIFMALVGIQSFLAFDFIAQFPLFGSHTQACFLRPNVF